MSTVLDVRNLTKRYPGFTLDHVSFSLEEGKITGFIGRNGAGKTTTLHSLLGFIHPDDGEIRFWGTPMAEQALQLRQRIGFVSSGMSFYPKKKLRTITDVTRRFYTHWDETAYRGYLAEFALDEEKTPEKLSNGMKIKYLLALALSHNADLLILDEPTSGLDPLSREELLEIFLTLRDRGKTILFSTHITSDLDKTADHILYLSHGVLEADRDLDDFVGDWRLAHLTEADLEKADVSLLTGRRRDRSGYTALVRAENAERLAVPCSPATLDEILIHLEKED